MNTRRVAYNVLSSVTREGAYANLSLKNALEAADPHEASWVSAAVYTTLENLIYIDYVIDARAKGRLQPAVRDLLRLGVCQLLFMNVPESAACNETVKLAKAVGKGALSGYINGVMRGIARTRDTVVLPEEPRKRMSVLYSYPEWLVDILCDDYGESFAGDYMSYKLDINTVRAQYPYTTDQLTAALDRRGLRYTPGEIVQDAIKLEHGLDFTAEPLFQKGEMTAQSQSAMLVCKLLDPMPGMRVLDACAAPGGKSAYLASLMGNEGHIEAWDLHAHRAELTARTLERLKVSCAEICTRDASVYEAKYDSAFDAVLVDAPCSGLGVSGKPDIRFSRSAQSIRELVELQHGILAACARYVKPGGTLVYATCTVTRAENEGQLERFLAEHPEYVLQDINPYLPPALQGRSQMGRIQLIPHLDDTEGFFMAKLQRKG